MPDSFFRRRLAAAMLVLLQPPALTLAQEEEARWFKVELMVFAQGEFDQVQEYFEPEPALAYPEQSRFLLYRDRVDTLQDAYPVTPERDEFGRILLTLPAAVEELTEGELPPRLPDTSADQARTTAAPGPASIDAPIDGTADEALVSLFESLDETLESEKAPRPVPFVTLPAEQRTLTATARTMDRSGGYRVLFHQAWQQPVAEQVWAVPIVLDDSGDTGQWPELQGSVLLYLSRFLHIETNLWRNTDGRYLGARWRMPPAPIGPASVIIEQEAPSLALLDAPNTQGDATPVAVTTVSGEVAEAPPAEVAGALATSELNIEDAPAKHSEAVPLPTLEPVYPFRHAVPMQQKRRMRSREVHYLDHPLLGVLVTLTPLSEEELALSAEEQALEWPWLVPAEEATGAPTDASAPAVVPSAGP